MFYRIRSAVIKVISAVLAMIAGYFELFMLHYRGPDLQWAVDEFDAWLKWQGKADKDLDPYDVREKLWEFINERTQ